MIEHDNWLKLPKLWLTFSGVDKEHWPPDVVIESKRRMFPMTHDTGGAPSNTPFAYDREKFERRVDELFNSFRVYREDSTVALDKATDANRDLASFNEKLMLLSLGTIGLSVSALISFVTKFALSGTHKVLVITLASAAWGMLLVAAILFRRLVSECMAANQKILFEWLNAMKEYNGSSISFRGRRVGLAFSGTAIYNDEIYDPKAMFDKLSDDTAALFASPEAEHFKNMLSQIKVSPKEAGIASWIANMLCQVALLLLAATAVVLFVRI